MPTDLYKNESINTFGKLPFVGDLAPVFTLVDKNISNLSLNDLKGKSVIINIFLSVHISDCAQSIRDLNFLASKNNDIIFLCISADLPLAMREFCTREGLDYIQIASFFNDKYFTDQYGVTINSGIFRGLAAPAVLGIDSLGIISYRKRVQDFNRITIFHDAIHSLNV
ncbi:thiol peroxidase [Photobacterium alginatilyticum]|uniref:thiol peroxidase n=1 Tax=Photobacterium alginatilyticum TaxID=1775171 RepID=UPI004067DEA4